MRRIPHVRTVLLAFSPRVLKAENAHRVNLEEVLLSIRVSILSVEFAQRESMLTIILAAAKTVQAGTFKTKK